MNQRGTRAGELTISGGGETFSRDRGKGEITLRPGIKKQFPDRIG